MLGFSTLAIAASLATLVAANHGHDLHARDHKHVRRAFSGKGTYYITGMGACGQYNNPSDKIVALNSAQYGGGYPGPQCFKMIRICEGSNCHNAQIVDECPTCAYGSLDMSQSLFEQFHDTGVGQFDITWTFVDGSSDDTPTSTKKPDPTTTWKPEPTTTWTPEPTTTWEPESTTSTKKKTTTSSTPETTYTPESTTSSTSYTPTTTSTTEVPTSTSVKPSTTSVPTSSAPSATASAATGSGNGGSSGSSSGSNLADANQLMLALGKMAVVAHGGQ